MFEPAGRLIVSVPQRPTDDCIAIIVPVFGFQGTVWSDRQHLTTGGSTAPPV